MDEQRVSLGTWSIVSLSQSWNISLSEKDEPNVREPKVTTAASVTRRGSLANLLAECIFCLSSITMIGSFGLP